jgi:hypothetical protein
VEHQRAFYAGMAQYLHEVLGLQSLVSASNWKTADARVLDSLERYTYMATDVLCDNNYFVPPYQSKRQHFYAVDAGEVYTDRPGLLEPQNLPIQLFAMADRPHMVTEMMWERPNRYRAEFPFLAATYGALQGMDGWVFFAVGGPEWESSPKVWSVMSPAMFGQFPALALMYRRGDVRPTSCLRIEWTSSATSRARRPFRCRRWMSSARWTCPPAACWPGRACRRLTRWHSMWGA